MKPIYYIFNKDEILAVVYKKDNTKIVFMRQPIINLEFGLQFYSAEEGKIEGDEEVVEILKDFICYPSSK